MYKVQNKVRAISNEIASETGMPVHQVELIIMSMWAGMKEYMEANRSGGIYLRNLGTFYVKDIVVEHIDRNYKKKQERKQNDTEQLQ